MTARRGRWLVATASAAVALSHSAAWGEAAEGATTGAAANAGPGDGTAAKSAPSAAPAVPVLRPQDELLLQVRTDKWILDEAFSGYSTATGSYLPLGSFSRLLDFAIVVDSDSGRAEGWFLDPKNTFRIDVNAGFVETKDGRKPLKPGDAIATLGDIYVRPALLAQWFPLEANVDLAKQQVQLKLLQTFPFEAKMAREQSRESLGFRSAAQRIAYPREATIYEMMSAPALDVNIHATTGTRQETTSQYDVRASGDLGFMSTDLFLSGDRKNPLGDARFVMRRRDPDGQMLGPLGLTLIEVGDTSSLAEPIGPRSRTGRGIVFGNVPVDRGSVFDKIDLRGELPIGYEVELYRNDVLISSVSQAVDGRYEFPQVPLEYGLNILRLVFYGPHGERREEVRQINAGEDRLAKGEFQYAVSAVQQDENLIPIHREEVPGSFLDKGAVRAIASAQYGLSSAVTGVAGLSSFVLDGHRIVQGRAGIRTNLGSAALQLDGAYQGGKAFALQAGFAGRLFGASYVLQHIEYGGDFVDELRSSTADDFKRYTQLRIDKGFSLGSRTIATNLVADRAQHGDTVDWEATFRASTSVQRWLISNSVDYHRVDSNVTHSQDLQGSFEVNGAVSGWGVRAGIDYVLRPGAKFRTLNLSIDHDVGGGALVRLVASRQLSGGSATLAGVSLSKRLGNFDFGADVQYDSGTKALVVGTRLSFSFGHGISGWRFAPPGLARGGSLLAVAFRDLNGDGRKEANEPALQDVGFRGGSGEVKTDARGMALISGLGDGRPTQVSMMTDTLPDPYLSPVKPGVEVVPRPGRTHVAMFPVATVSELEGKAYFARAGGKRAVSNVQLQLIDEKNDVIASAKTEYDGYFLMERVPPGRYRLRIDPDQATRLGIRLAQPVPVKAGADGGLIGDMVVNIVGSGSAADE